MAIGALTQAPVHLTVSVTGIAGPGGSQFKPEGLVCFGLANAQHVKTKLINFGAIGRKQVRLEARNYALSMIYKFLTEVQ
jgi:nicotinamide-nucleotide amidase